MSSTTKLFSVALIVCTTLGCTSFRTTSLVRFANDSLAPQRTNSKLKGLPVKLKVPSHVSVIVSEQQVILANDPTADRELKAAADAATESYLQAVDRLENLSKNIQRTRVSRELAEATLSTYETTYNSATGTQKTLAKRFLDEATKVYENAVESENNALLEAQREPELRKELDGLQAAMKLARNKATTRYTLVAFSPPQYQVETQLEYTDKIFLVDFKRPVAGVLDVKNAKMDDQQYFAQVQAEIEEQTIESISGALNTIKNPLLSLKPKAANSAKPTSASTPEAESKEDVHFQKSVVAIQRFDISVPDWEQQVMDFVNQRLGTSSELTGEFQDLRSQMSPQ